jgi:hypothetical protein
MLSLSVNCLNCCSVRLRYRYHSSPSRRAAIYTTCVYMPVVWTRFCCGEYVNPDVCKLWLARFMRHFELLLQLAAKENITQSFSYEWIKYKNPSHGKYVPKHLRHPMHVCLRLTYHTRFRFGKFGHLCVDHLENQGVWEKYLILVRMFCGVNRIMMLGFTYGHKT